MNLEIGDKATVNVPQENREWGYNPAPDGTEVEVVGFNEISYGRIHNFGHKPGIYHNRCWPKVRFPDGRIDSISDCHIKSQVQRPHIPWGKDKEKDFLRELPELPFWEMDLVYWSHSPSLIFTIESIDYDRMGNTRNDGSPFPIYHVRWPNGGTSFAAESELELVKRGNVWKYYHDETLEFVAGLMEEAQLHHLLGLTEEVKNPWSGDYRWDRDSILRAIREEIADGMMGGNNLFSWTPSVYAIRFKNQGLGKRVAKATLEGFLK